MDSNAFLERKIEKHQREVTNQQQDIWKQWEISNIAINDAKKIQNDGVVNKFLE